MKRKSKSSQSSLTSSSKAAADRPLTSDEQLEAALNSIPPEDAAILRSQLDIPEVKGSILALYRFCKPIDIFLVLCAFFFAAVEGAALPMFALVVGAITNNFQGFSTGTTAGDDFTSTVNHNALYYVYIGIVIIISGFLESFLFVNRGEVLASRYRKNYLRAVLNQNIAYFDRLGTGSVSTRITNSTSSIQDAISEKAGAITKSLACFITALCIALATQWKLALIILSLVVWLVIGVGFASSQFVKHFTQSEKTYAVGSNVADEAFSAARNTIALGAQDKMVRKYDGFLETSRKHQHKGNMFLALMLGILWSTVAFIYALAFWEGSRLLVRNEIDIGQVIVVFISLLVGAFQMTGIAPQIRFVVTGISGAKIINEAINRVPVIDAKSNEGERISDLKGHITLQNVRFRYPSRPSVLVLPNFSLEILPGQTVALVGASGSGKSTIIGLLERFYLYLGGSIKIDGVELSTLNVRWLRQQIGLVSQEPVLFANSIAENIEHGLIGTEFEYADAEKKRELVIDACKQANAWDFIQTLDEGLETNVGDRGFLLSGGQKQRIAIARAIVSNPKILLLDEATSALDTKSEGIVQEALDRAAKSRTTIVIAHRLSTIRDADKIVVMANGEIVEQGSHHELLAHQGAYHRLVELQKVDQQSQTPEKLQVNEDEFVAEDSFDASKCVIPGIDPVNVSVRKIVKLLWELNKKEQKLILLSFLFALTVGYAQDGYAMLLGKSSQSMMVTPEGYPHMRSTINLTSGMFFMVGMHQLIAGFIFIYLITTSSEHLLRNVRLALFKQFLRMDISFFDHEGNTPGALTGILAKDGKAIEGLGGATFGHILQCVVILVGGIITSIAFNWRLGLVGTACVPVIVGCGYGRIKILGRLEERSRKVYENSAGLASSFTSAVRTVQFLTREDQVCGVYNEVVDTQVVDSLKATVASAAAFGLAEGLLPWIFALIWWYGSKLLREGKTSVYEYYVVFIGLILGAQSAGQAFSYAPDLSKAKTAAANVLRMTEAKPIIDPWDQKGTIVDRAQLKGCIEFKNIFFRYPTRPQVPVLRDVSLKVEPGQYVALVGASGCGKSTSIGLCERFYDPMQGQVMLDGVDLREYNINSLRACMGLVQQEPLLYSGTVRENITLGVEDGSVSQEQIEDASRQANIHDFIMGLPDGYDTDVGAAGTLLSGGQKQRIAIARTIIRDPAILLLDEATSALDAESEKLVQAALDNVMKGRTILSVAHRLSTIQHADKIYVFDKGRIVESGTHQELLNVGGRYAELVRLQSLEEA